MQGLLPYVAGSLRLFLWSAAGNSSSGARPSARAMASAFACVARERPRAIIDRRAGLISAAAATACGGTPKARASARALSSATFGRTSCAAGMA
jgi:hypothetical protein